MAEFIILAAALAIIVYISILLFLITGLLRREPEKCERQPTVCVVIAVRNEEQNIGRCLRALTQQSYSRSLMQIVVVDDRSTDHTSDFLNEYQSVHPDLFTIVKVSNTPDKTSPKKFALSLGIAQATGEIIFTTDADCAPPPTWIAETVPLFREQVGVVIGLAPFEHNGRLWDKVLALDNCASALVAAGAANWGVGVTCTGRNLAYRKQVFVDVNGFSSINHSLSGDDDLFLQQVKKQTNWHIEFSLNPDTAVYSQAAKNLSAYVAQRRRHVSAAKYFSRPFQLAYFLFNLSNLALYVFLIWGFFKPAVLLLGVLFFNLKWLLDFVALFLITKRLQQSKLLRLLPLWEIFFVLNQTFISPLGFIGKIKWK